MIKELLPISINKKHMLTKVDCSVLGRKKCQGKCCKVDMSYARYYPEEVNKLPKNIRSKLFLREGFYCCKKDKEGNCELLDDCLKNPKIKPLKCQLFPFKVSKGRRLYLARWLWYGYPKNYCPNYGRGKPSYVSLKKDLINIFGKGWYNKLEKFMQSDLNDDDWETFDERNIDDWQGKESKDLPDF